MTRKLFLGLFVLLISFPAVFGVNATNTTYNLMPATEQNDVLGFVTTVNDMTDKVFMIGVLLVTFVIFFVALLRYGTSDALLASGFITSVITVMFATLNFIPTIITILILVSYGSFFSYRIVRG